MNKNAASKTPIQFREDDGHGSHDALYRDISKDNHTVAHSVQVKVPCSSHVFLRRPRDVIT